MTSLTDYHFAISGLATETTSVAYSSNHGGAASNGAALYQRNPNPTTYVTPGDRGEKYCNLDVPKGSSTNEVKLFLLILTPLPLVFMLFNFKALEH